MSVPGPESKIVMTKMFACSSQIEKIPFVGKTKDVFFCFATMMVELCISVSAQLSDVK